VSDPGKAVFLSYASQDAEAAKRICDALRAAGVEVWFDQSELRGGDSWDAKIRKQIKECALFVPVITPNTNSRPEGYFRLEWKLAVDRSHLLADDHPFLFPIVIGDVTEATARVPDKFRDVQWTRLRLDETPAELARRVAKLLSGAITEDRGQRTEGRPAGHRHRPAWLRYAWAGVGILFAVIYAIRPMWQTGRKEPEPGRTTKVEVTAAPMTEAQKLVAKARKIYEEGDELDRETLILAEDLVKRALVLDPAEPSAWELSARLSVAMVWYSFDQSEVRREAMQRQAARARALAPESVQAQLVYAHARLALAYSVGLGANQDLAGIERDMLALAGQEPQNWQVYKALGTIYRFLDRPDEAFRAFQRAIELSGGDPGAVADLLNVMLRRKRYAEAETYLAPALAKRATGRLLTYLLIFKTEWRGDLAGAQAALTSWPGWLLREDRGAFFAWQTWMWSRQPDKALEVVQRLQRDYLHDTFFSGPRAVLSARAHEMAGHAEAAQADWRVVVQLADRELAVSPEDAAALFWKAWALCRVGDKTGAQAICTLLQQRNLATRSFFFHGTSIAQLWATMGQTDLAVAELRAKSASMSNAYAITRSMLELDPAYESLRSDPRYPELLESALAPEQKPAAPAAGDKSVAVLAFANLSDDKGNEYFSDGISEELLNVLAQVPGLKVSARTSSFHFKGKDTPIPEIAQQLGVAYVVEGSVRKQGDKVRITAQLIRADGGFHVWSDTFTRDLKDVFAVQDEIAGLIAQQLQLKLGATPRVAKTVNPEAHQLYLQGKYFLNQFSVDSANRAVSLLQQAVELDPSFAPAWAALSRAGSVLGGYADTRQDADKGMALARQAAERALALEPDLAAAYLALAEVQTGHDFDWKGAAESLRRALALAPTDAAVVDSAARLAYYFGQKERAVELGAQAVALDPVNPSVRVDHGFALNSVRRFKEAEAEFRRLTELNPKAPWGHAGTSFNYTTEGRFDEAAAEAAQETNEWSRLFALTLAQWGQKKQPESDATLAQFIKADADIAAYQIAEIYAFRRDNDRAFEWLERAYRQRDPGLAWARPDIFLENLHADPRWEIFMHKLGLTDEQLK
jgi:TolB-like protein/Flp pilus assembly protein TadD